MDISSVDDKVAAASIRAKGAGPRYSASPDGARRHSSFHVDKFGAPDPADLVIQRMRVGGAATDHYRARWIGH